MSKRVESTQKNLFGPLQFDPMSSSTPMDGEEEKSDKQSMASTTNFDSGYVSFPRHVQQRRGSGGGDGTEIGSAVGVSLEQNSSSGPARTGVLFDPYASVGQANHPMSDVLIEENDELLLFDVTSAMSPSRLSTKIPAPNSLFDDDDSTAAMSVELPTIASNEAITTKASSLAVPGAAGYLEMEQEPPRDIFRNTYSSNGLGSENIVPVAEPIRTDSGLLLTHRKVPAASLLRNPPQLQPHKRTFRSTQQDYFEVENGFFNGSQNQQRCHPHSRAAGAYAGKHSMVMVQAKRLMSFVKIWMVVFAVALLVMTGALIHSFGHKDTVQSTSAATSVDVLLPDYTQDAPEEILLLPLNDISQLSISHGSQHHRQLNAHKSIHLKPLHEPSTVFHPHRHLHDLRHAFAQWIIEHKKFYHSHEEKEKRFSIWVHNHHKTVEKNERHGPCKMTKQPVFGSNHFKDLTQQEFKEKYLTGYTGLFHDELERRKKEISDGPRKLKKDSGMVLDPSIHKVNFHETVRQRMLKHNPQVMDSIARQGSTPNCKWYDMSCILRWIWSSTGIQFGTLIGTMEPRYDSNAYPNSVDWRDSGAVTDVRTQGDCGACWAVTAVETVESAHFLSTGNLYELSESEIIACDDSCEMCSGGWPQNAYEWVMDHGGLPLFETFPYNADTLKALTQGLQGEGNYEEADVESYRQGMCPNGDGNSKSHDSNDNSYWEDGKENGNYADYSSQGRYGNIKGYGYATERCICYTDGSGCDCDDQDEDTAVRNIASYGPAVVCLDASLWQDYSGGIMTADIGCSAEFLDMNHCVQVVGYAFTTDADCDGEDCDGEDQNGHNSGSGSDSKSKSGSRDSGQRRGYWIVRNQWGQNWGLNGYAWVAMGKNTCGVLNDMTIAYA